MGSAPEPLLWMNFKFQDEEGNLQTQEFSTAELHTDSEFGYILFDPVKGLLKLQKLQGRSRWLR